MRKRDLPWEKKVDEVYDSFSRVKDNKMLARQFYHYLFKIKPDIESYFKEVDFSHQEELILRGIQFALDSIHGDQESKIQMIRIAKTHSQANLNVSPHLYYYFIEALVYAVRKNDSQWYEDLEYYWSEVMMRPVSFMISQYYRYTEKLDS